VNAEAVMEEDIEVLSAENTVEEVREWITQTNPDLTDAIAVVDENENLIGTLKLKEIQEQNVPLDTPVAKLIKKQKIYVYNNSQLSFAVDLMDRFKVDYLPVVDRNNKRKVLGILTHKDIFSAYRKRRNEEDIFKRAISLRRRGYKLIVKGKQLLKADH
jgi:predicted transcriptional regulator